ncbi:hypothetical protein QL285_031804 [Trifolium repens]|nr:hypothetical protein QL285_031804 [Trifolium repens]
MTTKADGVKPSRAEIYIDTRTRNDGSIVTVKAAATIKHIAEADNLDYSQFTQDSTNWKNDTYSKVKGPERRGRVRCLGRLPKHARSSVSSQPTNSEVRLQKVESLLGNLVSVLQTRFSEDPHINAVLQAVAQEVPDVANGSIGINQQTTSDTNSLHF